MNHKLYSTLTFCAFLNLWLFFTPTFGLKAQSADSFLAILDTTASDEIKVNAYNELCWLYLFEKPELAKDYAEKSIALCEKHEWYIKLSYGLNGLANYWLNRGIFTKAETYFERALQLRLDSGDSLLIGWSYNNLGNLYRAKGQQNMAFQNYFSAKQYLQTKGGETDRAKVWTSLGYLYQNSGAFDKALEAFTNGLVIRDTITDINGTADSYLALGGFHQELKRYALARDNYRLALKNYTSVNNHTGSAQCWNNLGNSFYLQNKGDSALSAYTKAKALYQKLNNQMEIAGVLNNIGQTYARQNNYPLAKTITKASLKKYIKMDNRLGIAECLLNLGIIYNNVEGQQDSAISYFQGCLKTASRQNFKLLLSRALKELSALHQSRGEKDKALQYLTQYAKVNDTLTNAYQNSVNLQFKFENEQRKRIEEEAQRKLLEEENKHQAIIIFRGRIIFFLALVTILFLLVIHRQHRARLKLENEKKDQLLNSTRAILEMKDSERKRIARDLHDHLGGMLSSVKVSFMNTEKKLIS